MFSVEAIAEVLEKYRQRATYGAVAGLLGVPTRSLMRDYAKSPRYSWIVNQKTGLPTDYGASQIHPELASRDEILCTEAELVAWLRSVG
jgi:hypothetical protein